MSHVIYLTGPPATGKSTLLDAVTRGRQDVIPFSYGAELTQLANQRAQRALQKEDLRRECASRPS